MRHGKGWIGLLAVGVLSALVAGCDFGPKESVDTLIISADNRISAGQYNAALIDLKNALALAPGSHAARARFAEVLMQLGDAQSAEIEMRKAMNSGHDPVSGELFVIDALIAQDQYDRARDLHGQMVEKTRSDRDVHAWLIQKVGWN